MKPSDEGRCPATRGKWRCAKDDHHAGAHEVAGEVWADEDSCASCGSERDKHSPTNRWCPALSASGARTRWRKGEVFTEPAPVVRPASPLARPLARGERVLLKDGSAGVLVLEPDARGDAIVWCLRDAAGANRPEGSRYFVAAGASMVRG